MIFLMIYKNHFVLIKTLHVFLGNHNSQYVCCRCLNCFKLENVLVNHTKSCELQDITAIKFSKDNHLMWKKHFHEIPQYLKIYGDFECNNKIEDSHIANRTTNIFRQIPTCNGIYIVFELNNVLQSGYQSCFGENNVEWFAIEVIKIENKMKFYLKNTKKDIVVTQKN